jgi:type IV secretory pathway VirB4 component
MRIIPKNTKVKLQFYKGIGIADVIIGVIALAFIALAASSNLPNKYWIAVGILIVVIPMYIPLGEIKLYQAIGYAFKFLVVKKTFSKEKGNINEIIPYSSIKENCIIQKDGTYTGVIQITPIEFNMLSEAKQNFLIDGVMANTLKNVNLFQEYDIVKVEKPIIFDDYLNNELTRIQSLIAEHENDNLNENEFRQRVAIIEDRINLIQSLNTEQKIYSSAYYIALHDIDKDSLNNSLEIIENSLNNSGIQVKRLNSMELAIFLKYNYNKEFDEREFEQYQEKEYIKNIVPNEVKFKALTTKQNDKYLTHFVITDYPLKVDNAWAQEIFDIPNTKVILKSKPVEKYKAIKRIDNAINELMSQSNFGRASSQIDKQTHLESLQILLEGLQNDNEVFFDTTVIITSYDDNKDMKNKKYVRRKLRELGFKFSEMFGRQVESYFSANVNKCNSVKISRGLNSSVIASTFPFVSNAILDENGLLIGENRLPAFIDFFKRDDERVNSNTVIIGKSGSGKSYATKVLLTNLASDNAKIFILDPENEYGNLATNLKGTVLDVSSSKNGRINPFHIISSLDDENNDGTSNSFYSHLQFLEEFFRVILPGINSDSMELLNKIIVDVYAAKGINEKTDLTKLSITDYPIFEDLGNLVDKKIETEKDEYNLSCYKVLSNYISKFRKGGRNSDLWNGYTTFKPIENFVVFNFQKLLANHNNQIGNAQMLLVLKWLDNEVIKNRDYNILNGTNRKIVIAIDEAHVFIDEKFPIALDFMYNLAKRIRKYNGMQIVITQNIKDFVGSPEIARKSSAIINVSQYSFIFSLSPNDMSDLCTLYEKAGQINDNEVENIVNLPRGSAFLITGPAYRTNIRIVATPLVKETFE